jgi:hypothetical protein
MYVCINACIYKHVLTVIQLTAWNRVIAKKLSVSSQSLSSLLCEPANVPYPEPDESSSHPHTYYFFKRNVRIIALLLLGLPSTTLPLIAGGLCRVRISTGQRC